MKRFLVLFSAILCLLSCFACGKTEPPPAQNASGTAEVSVDTDSTLDLCIFQFDTLNPLKTSARHTAEVLSLLYDSLYTPLSDFTAEKNIATNCKISADGLTAHIHIKENVQFQNGITLTAKDVAASFNAVVASDGYYKKRLFMIENATVTENTVVLHLNQPTPKLQMLLDIPILPATEADFSETTDIMQTIASGSGLFALSEIQTGNALLLSATPNHHSGKKSHIEKVKIHFAKDCDTALLMLENGTLDGIASYAIPSHFTSRNQLNYVSYPGLHFFFLGIGNQMKHKLSLSAYETIQNSLYQAPLFSDTEPFFVKTKVPVHPSASFEDTAPNNLHQEAHLPTAIRKIELLTNEASAQKVHLAQKVCKVLREQNFDAVVEQLSEKEMKDRMKRGSFDFVLGETLLLPNFNMKDLETLTTSTHISQGDERMAPALISLAFENESFLCQSYINANQIATLNPYQSLYQWY